MQYSENDLKNAQSFNPSLIREDISDWLNRLQQSQSIGRFAFCELGNLVPTKGKRAYMPSVFAIKIAWQIGLWDVWPADLREAMKLFLYEAQAKDGSFVDPWLRSQTRINWRDIAKVVLRRNTLRSVTKYYADWDERNIRAETRQSIATLIMVGSFPKYAPPIEVTNYNDTRLFLEGLDWSNPWGAGSHLSHQIMLSSVHEKMNSEAIKFGEVKRAIFEFLAEIYHENDGTWYVGKNISNAMKINGAMKIFSGLQWVKHPFESHNRLIDLVLSEPFYSDGCHFTNSLFVLHQIMRVQGRGYRQEEIDERARISARCLMLHKKKNSGFSFFQNKAQVGYYTSKVSKGCDQADLHGTVMYTWACAIIIDILKNEHLDEAKFWKIQIP